MVKVEKKIIKLCGCILFGFFFFFFDHLCAFLNALFCCFNFSFIFAPFVRFSYPTFFWCFQISLLSHNFHSPSLLPVVFCLPFFDFLFFPNFPLTLRFPLGCFNRFFFFFISLLIMAQSLLGTFFLDLDPSFIYCLQNAKKNSILKQSNANLK